MKLKLALFLLPLIGTSLLSAMGHYRPTARLIQLLKHLTEAPRAIPYGPAPGVAIDPDLIVGKHKHLFNFVCSKVVSTIGV